ncbi:MAG TPA: phosphatase PAP2 family protein [Thermoanaerobaculia bacterium]|nr:phosphatase PAP2 family protein [Thermoanaerobaculia bacterium]
MRTYGAVLRPHAYEIFLLVSFVLAHFAVSHFAGLNLVFELAASSTFAIAEILAKCLLLGVALRVAGGLVTGSARGYLRQILRWPWWLESARLILFGALATHVYSFLKVLMPRLTTRNADAFLWELDRMILFGHSPSVLLLELFHEPFALSTVDWMYSYVFNGTLWTVFVLALSSPSQRIRVSFVGAKAMLWVVGAALYYTLPSLGPAYRFEEVWHGAMKHMPFTFATLQALMGNYVVVLGKREGIVNFLFGIGAFPSLHVAFQVFVALWARRFTRAGGAVAIAAAMIIFTGSIVTGWHYLADSLAGVVLAVLAYVIMFRVYRIGRWIRLFRVYRRPRPRLNRLMTL